ncbi:MAG: glutathione S-transferase family protein [Pseudomonadota bacterium]
MPNLVFYTNPMSRARIARWMLEEVGEPYETVTLTYGPEMASAAYRAVNPMAKVPALRHGGVVVTETAAICAYLADIFPEKRLAPPAGDPRRGAYYRALFFSAGPVEAASTNASFGWAASSFREEARLGYGSQARVQDALEQILGAGPWLLGDAFSAADIYVAGQLTWLLQFELFEKRPVFTEYVARATARPAAIRARQIDDALMAEAQAEEQAAGTGG